MIIDESYYGELRERREQACTMAFHDVSEMFELVSPICYEIVDGWVKEHPASLLSSAPRHGSGMGLAAGQSRCLVLAASQQKGLQAFTTPEGLLPSNRLLFAGRRDCRWR